MILRIEVSGMKLKGEYVLREVMGETLLIPLGETALSFNGMITLDPVGAVIWKGLEAGEEKSAILQRILDQFDVEADVAARDLDEFLDQMEKAGLLQV